MRYSKYAAISPSHNAVCSLLRLLLLRKMAFKREGSGAEVAIKLLL